MKHAVILAHPDPKSFNASVAGAYVSSVLALGHQVVLRDLYALDFDPRLGRRELPWKRGYAPRKDVRTERAALADADVFVFVYPLWFNTPPAILKGYVDRVFGMGFGFQASSGVSDPMLVDKKLLSFTTSGAPETWLRDTGALAALTQLFDKHLSAMCGLRVLDHVHIGAVTPLMSKEGVEASLKAVDETVGRYFAAA